ncbi:MAG: NupC/NupG family nucleoside CNT transporter [Alphaproteobacteria bacterium]
MEAHSFLFFQGLFGLFAFLIIGWVVSENRRSIDYTGVAAALVCQVILAYVSTQVGVFRAVLLAISNGIMSLKTATIAGTSFVFGYLGGGDLPFQLKEGASAFIFAFQPLPMLIVISALSMLLFHWGILPIIVKGFSWALRKTLRIGGALGVCSAAKVFLGQTEAPLLIRPYLKSISRSELFSVMVLGMSTTSASMLVLYATLLENTISEPVSHILTASVISVPAALALSRVMIPHIGAATEGTLVVPYEFSGSMDAVSQGASDGLKLFLNIIAMLVVVLALVSLANTILEAVSPAIAWVYDPMAGALGLGLIGDNAVTLQDILGVIMSPLAWLMGIPVEEAFNAGKLLGTKTVLNEVMAFISQSELPDGSLGSRANLIMSYALCGFANFSSIGILIGGIGGMVPERRAEVIELGFKAMIAGTMASCMSGTVIGLLWWLS